MGHWEAGAAPAGAGPLPSGPGPIAADKLDKLDKTPEGLLTLPADLARLAVVWAQIPAAVRLTWIQTAEALAGEGKGHA